MELSYTLCRKRCKERAWWPNGTKRGPHRRKAAAATVAWDAVAH